MYNRGSPIVNSILSIITIMLLLISSISILIGSGDGEIGDFEENFEDFLLDDEILITPARLFERAVIDVKSASDNLSCRPGEQILFNFTVEELYGLNITMTTVSFDLYSFDMAVNYDTQTIYDLGITVSGGSIANGQAILNISSDVCNEAARNGDDGIILKMNIAGIDEKGNCINTIIWSRATITMKVVVLVQDNIVNDVRRNLDRYYSDVKERNDIVFIERSKHWETPESVREDLISIWENESITGAILIGDMPYAIWEINHSDGSKEPCPIPIFYEDMDGDFKDNNSNGSYDLHYWGENDGPEIWVSFLSPPSETIPSTHLRTGGGVITSGLTGTYFSDNNHLNQVLRRNDKEIEFYWVDEDPPSPVPDDSFSIIWEGQVKAEHDETYTFEVIHGGGIALKIDSIELLRDDTCPPWNRKMKVIDVNLTSGWHDIELSYRENGWGDYKGQIRLCWRSDSTVGRIINEWFDKDHSYHTGEMNAPERGLLFMDYAYGMQCKMLQPIKEKHLEPLFGEHLNVGGGQNTTNATEYLEFLDMGHELTSIWSHAGGGGHQFGVPPDSGAEFSAAQSYQIKQTNGSLVTLIWGCHAGDFANTGATGSVTKTENLVVNYAFNTKYGLAAMGCTRSYGTTFDRVYHDLKEDSYLGLGYFHFKEVGYDREKRMSEPHPLGEKMWIEDEVMFGDPFLRIYHFPDTPKVEIENGSRFDSGKSVALSIESEGADQMRITHENGQTQWIDFNRSYVLDITTKEGMLDVTVETRNGYGQAPMYSSDKILIESTPPEIRKFTINGGAEATNNSSVVLEMSLFDDFSGLDAMCFSNNGVNWTEWEEITAEKRWDLDDGEGEKCVHIMVRDISGNYAASTSSIIFDSIGPKVWIDILGNVGNNSWYVSDVEFRFYSLDEDISSILFRIGDREWRNYEQPVVLTKDGVHTIQFYSIDILGNIGPLENVGIMVDDTPPENVSLEISNENECTNDTIQHLLIEGYDAASGIDKMAFRSSNEDDWSPWIDFNNSYDLDIGDIDGSKKIGLRVSDLAGNVLVFGEPIDIILDTKDPILLHHYPKNGATVNRTTTAVFKFSEEIDPDSIKVLVVDQNREEVEYDTISKPSGILEISPMLFGYMTCVITLSDSISDLAGNRIKDPIILTFNVTGTPPGPPEDLEAVMDGNDILLTWNASSYEGELPILSYNIFRLGVETGWEKIGTTIDKLFVDSSFEPGYTYHYRITASNQHEEGDPSNEVAVTIPDEVGDDDDSDGEQDDRDEKGSSSSPALIIISIVALLIILVLIIFLLFNRKGDNYPEE